MQVLEKMKNVEDKYKVLALFIYFTMNNGFAWLMFDPVAEWLENNVIGLNRTQLELLSSWQPIVFLTMCFPIMKLVTRYDGLRTAVRLGVSAEVIGGGLKLIGILSRGTKAGLPFLHIGQIFSGIGSPVATGCVSALSATWFEPSERTRATAAAVMFNSVGNALCYILIPSMTLGPIEFTGVIVYELCMGCAAAALVWLVFPQERLVASVDVTVDVQEPTDVLHFVDSTAVTPAVTPAATPRAAGEGGGDDKAAQPHEKMHASLKAQLIALFKMPSVAFLLIIYAWLCGGFSAWISLFAATYNTFIPETSIGIMCFFAMFSYVMGGLVSSYIVELYFARQMKYVILFCVTMNAVSNLMFIAASPNDKGYYLWNLGLPFTIFCTSLCGFWNGAAAPLFFELVAEISFPVEEGVSGISISICENLGALFFYQIVSRFFRGQSMSVAYSVGMTIAVPLCAAVKQRYNRTYHAYITSRKAARTAAA